MTHRSRQHAGSLATAAGLAAASVVTTRPPLSERMRRSSNSVAVSGTAWPTPAPKGAATRAPRLRRGAAAVEDGRNA